MTDHANEIHARIAAASGRRSVDTARTLAAAAIRDGENWNDRRLPEMGRALDAALDEIDALLAGHAAEVGRLREWVARLLASSEQELARGADREARAAEAVQLDFVFQRTDGQEVVFVEVEDDSGRSVRCGEWVDRGDGYRVLRVLVDRSSISSQAERQVEARAALSGRGSKDPIDVVFVCPECGVMTHSAPAPALAAAQEPPPATEGLPSDLARVLRDQSVVVSQDGAVFDLIGKWANAPSDTASGVTETGAALVAALQDGAVFDLIGKWANAPSDTASGAAQEPPAVTCDECGETGYRGPYGQEFCAEHDPRAAPPAKGDDRG